MRRSTLASFSDMTAQSRSDSELMQLIARGDASAFRALSTEHLKPIVTYCYRLLGNHAEAEETAQEVFLRAWQKAPAYRPEARISTWLHRIAHNLAIDALRKRHGGTLELDDERDEAPTSNDPSLLMERKATSHNVLSALQLLPERQKMALLLCHEQGLSNPEIATVMETQVEAVESLLARGRKKLRALLTLEAPERP